MAAPARFGRAVTLRGQLTRVLCCLALLGAIASPSFAAKWSDIDPQELADRAPRIDPEAGAEILYRELSVQHVAANECVRAHHVRAKIYSDRGLEHFAKVDLPYGENAFIRDVRVRTIKANGEIMELSPKDIFQREIIKARRERVKVKSFSPAGLEVGAMVEYQFTEVTRAWSWYEMMLFQSALPARHVRLRFSSLIGIGTRALFFNCPQQSMKPDRQGYHSFEMRDVPAAKDEPHQPPLIQVQSGVLISYSLAEMMEPNAYWEKFGRSLHERMLRETKPTKQVRAALAGIVSDGDSEAMKLEKIYDFCRSKLIDRYSDIARFTPEERTKFKPNETATDTLNRGHGTLEDINVAFVALARAAGFDARYAAANNRSAIFFKKNVTEAFMVSDLIAAVRTDGAWRYFDPGVRYLPFGTPHWQNTGTAVIIAAPKDAAPVTLEFSLPKASQELRIASFELEGDGTLAGTVKIEYTGNLGLKMKQILDAKSVTERETYVREEVQEQLKLAEVTEIKVEYADDPIVPLAVSYALRIAGYADRTGSRLFFQPAVFQKNVPQLFPEATRQHAILFPYRYAEADTVRIKLPADFELEQANAPAALDLGQVATYKSTIGVTKSGTVIYNRAFSLNAPSLPASIYPGLREAFAEIHARDNHTLTLRRKEATPAASVAAAP